MDYKKEIQEVDLTGKEKFALDRLAKLMYSKMKGDQYELNLLRTKWEEVHDKVENVCLPTIRDYRINHPVTVLCLYLMDAYIAEQIEDGNGKIIKDEQS